MLSIEGNYKDCVIINIYSINVALKTCMPLVAYTVPYFGKYQSKTFNKILDQMLLTPKPGRDCRNQLIFRNEGMEVERGLSDLFLAI